MASNEKTLKNILERLSSLEARAEKLESQKEPLAKPVTAAEVESFGNLSGELNLLVKEGFLNSAKSVDQIQKELERQGHSHPSEVIETLLRRDYVKRRQTMTRVERDGVWFYVSKSN